MGNIWGFLLQTVSVSLTAGLLLVVKRLLADKLSPRWQYGIWNILALPLPWERLEWAALGIHCVQLVVAV